MLVLGYDYCEGDRAPLVRISINAVPIDLVCRYLRQSVLAHNKIIGTWLALSSL